MSKTDYISAHFAGGRLSGQPSSAKEARFYRDPAKGIEFESAKGKAMNDKELDAYCWAWNHWCYTRKYYISPGAKNILARMQPSRVGQPPNAALSDEMNYFNMAIHALADMKDSDTECFVKYYAEIAQDKLPIKTIADRMGIGVRTFYDRKARFARKAYSMAASMKRAHLNSVETKTATSEEID